MSLTRDQTYQKGVSCSDGFGDAGASRVPGMRCILYLGRRLGIHQRAKNTQEKGFLKRGMEKYDLEVSAG